MKQKLSQLKAKETRLQRNFNVFLFIVFLSGLIFASCQQTKPTIPKYSKTDTFTLALTVNGSKEPYQVKALIDTIGVGAEFKSPGKTLDARWKIDTLWSVIIIKDTVRGADKKPIYDSAAKQYKFIYDRRVINKNSVGKIQIIY